MSKNTKTIEQVKVHCQECGVERDHPQDAREQLMMKLFGLCNKCSTKWQSIEPIEQEEMASEDIELEYELDFGPKPEEDIMDKINEFLKEMN